MERKVRHIHRVSTLTNQMEKILKASPRDFYFMRKPNSVLNKKVLNFSKPRSNMKKVERGADKNRKNLNEKRQSLKDVCILKSGKNIVSDSEFNEYIENKFYEQFYIIEMLNAIYAILSLILGTLHYEWTYKENEVKKLNSYSTLLYFVTFFSILIWLNAVFYQIIHLNFLKAKGYLKSDDTIFTTYHWVTMMVEIGIFFIHPNILFLNKTYVSFNKIYLINSERSINSILNIFLITRLYYLVRYVIYFVNYMDPITNRICKTYFFKVNFLFSVKVLFKNYPFLIYMLFGSCFLFSYSYCVRIFERDLTAYSHQDFNNIWNVWWYIMITMLTVGYGDYSTKTNEGRVFAMGACITGVFLTSMMLISVENYLQLNNIERTVLTIMNKVEENEEISEISRSLIKKFGKFVVKNKKIKSKKTMTTLSTHDDHFKIGIKELNDEINRKSSQKIYDLIAPPLKTSINSMTFLFKEFNDLKIQQNNFFNDISDIKMQLNNTVMLIKNHLL